MLLSLARGQAIRTVAWKSVFSDIGPPLFKDALTMGKSLLDFVRDAHGEYTRFLGRGEVGVVPAPGQGFQLSYLTDTALALSAHNPPDDLVNHIAKSVYSASTKRTLPLATKALAEGYAVALYMDDVNTC